MAILNRLAIGLVLALYVVFSSMWAIRVPAFSPPDEMAHADYMFAFFDANGFYHIAGGSQRGSEVLPQTKYIDKISGFRQVRYNPLGRVPTGYGTADFFKHADDQAPVPSNLPRAVEAKMPYVMFGYPATYYVIVAKISRLLTFAQPHSAMIALIVARFVNIAFGFLTLILAYSTFRRYGISKASSVLSMAGIAMLPLFCWVSAYIQPDNLVTLLITFTIWASKSPRWKIQLLSLGVCSVILVKIHYGVAILLPLSLHVFTESKYSAKSFLSRVVFIAVLPIISMMVSLQATPIQGGLLDDKQIMKTGVAVGPNISELPLSKLLAKALTDVYGGGSAFTDYWTKYGSRGSHIPVVGEDFVLAVLIMASLTMLFAIALSQIKTILRIVKFISTHKAYAIKFLIGDLAIGVYLIYTSLLILTNIRSNGLLVLQGRYWIPIIVPMTILMVRYAPRLLHRVIDRKKASLLISGTTAVFAVGLNVFTPWAIEKDFYIASAETANFNFGSIVVNESGTYKSFLTDRKRVNHNDRVRVTGYGVDVLRGTAVNDVSIYADGKFIGKAKTGFSRLPVASQYFDDMLDTSGFILDLPAYPMGIGVHEISAVVGTLGGMHLPLRRHVTVEIY